MMRLDKGEIKKLLKPFLIIFLVNFLIVNWPEISWLFNYKVVSGAISEFSLKFRPKFFSKNEGKITKFEFSIKGNSLEIPKIEISTPLILVNNEREVCQSLDRGVVLFPNSVLPGQTGETLILGHSAPLAWPKIKYYWVFSQLNELEIGDEIYLHFDHQKYSYSVTQKVFLDRGEEIPSLTNSENVLVLISCWPPGKDLKRIAIVAPILNTKWAKN